MCKKTTQEKLDKIEDIIEQDSSNGRHLIQKVRKRLEASGLDPAEIKEKLSKLKEEAAA